MSYFEKLGVPDKDRHFLIVDNEEWEKIIRPTLSEVIAVLSSPILTDGQKANAFICFVESVYARGYYLGAGVSYERR